jgi:hypothetical protein
VAGLRQRIVQANLVERLLEYHIDKKIQLHQEIPEEELEIDLRASLGEGASGEGELSSL